MCKLEIEKRVGFLAKYTVSFTFESYNNDDDSIIEVGSTKTNSSNLFQFSFVKLDHMTKKPVPSFLLDVKFQAFLITKCVIKLGKVNNGKPFDNFTFCSGIQLLQDRKDKNYVIENKIK